MKFDEAENRRKLHELLDIALLCNGYKARKREKTGTLPTMFFDFSGHVGTLRITLYSNGWDSDVDYDRNWTIDTDKPIPDEYISAIRAAADEAMNTTEEDALVFQIAEAERELERRKAELNSKKRILKEMQKKGA